VFQRPPARGGEGKTCAFAGNRTLGVQRVTIRFTDCQISNDLSQYCHFKCLWNSVLSVNARFWTFQTLELRVRISLLLWMYVRFSIMLLV